MKCDKLKKVENPIEWGLYYDKSKVDAAIAELKAKLEDVQATAYAESVDASIAELKSENERLNRELEHVKNGDCINTCDVVEKHVKEEIKAKRALWLARANYCHNFRVDWYISRHPHSKMRQSVMENTLIMAEMNCRKKAREYK